MVDQDAYCIDILTQISAASRALQAVALELLDAHLAHCVRDAIDQGGPGADAKIAEASAAIASLVKS
jgi:DNA-binding FrmR family transcriptional regulator